MLLDCDDRTVVGNKPNRRSPPTVKIDESSRGAGLLAAASALLEQAERVPGRSSSTRTSSCGWYGAAAAPSARASLALGQVVDADVEVELHLLVLLTRRPGRRDVTLLPLERQARALRVAARLELHPVVLLVDHVPVEERGRRKRARGSGVPRTVERSSKRVWSWRQPRNRLRDRCRIRAWPFVVVVDEGPPGTPNREEEP